jgi:hypothetical protein
MFSLKAGCFPLLCLDPKVARALLFLSGSGGKPRAYSLSESTFRAYVNPKG